MTRFQSPQCQRSGEGFDGRLSQGPGHLMVRALCWVGVLAVGSVAAMTPGDLAARLARNENLLIVDVRSATAYASGHIPGAINVSLGLLPHKTLPSSPMLVVYGDGIGVIDDGQALAVARAKQGGRADVLEGGYATWLSETRLSTALPGIGPEKLPGITYDQLVATGKSGMVLVDLRANAVAAAPAGGPSKERLALVSAAPDILAEFASKIGVPVVSANGSVAVDQAQNTPTKAAAGPARAAAAVPAGGQSNQLMVLVADSDAAASEAARQLRASGNYRFTILVGGTEAIRREGRTGTGRMDGAGAPVTR